MTTTPTALRAAVQDGAESWTAEIRTKEEHDER